MAGPSTAATDDLADAPDTLLPIATAGDSWRWLRAELRRNVGATTAMLLVGIVAAGASVLPTYVLAELIDRVRDRDPVSSITVIAVVIVVAAIVGGVTTGVSTYLVSKLGETLLARLR